MLGQYTLPLRHQFRLRLIIDLIDYYYTHTSNITHPLFTKLQISSAFNISKVPLAVDMDFLLLIDDQSEYLIHNL